VESSLADEQCGFRPGRGTTDQIFTLQQIFEKSWEFDQQVYACFVDLEKVYDRVPRNLLWGVMQEYGVDGQLLAAVKSLYECSSSCVRVNGRKSEPFPVHVGLRQGCVLSPLLFIIFMDWIDGHSHAGEGITIGNCRVSRLLFADDMVLLSPSQSDLQQALDRFTAQCNNAGMRISAAKTETLVLSRRPARCDLRLSGSTLKQVDSFKYLGVAFTSDGRLDTELNTRIAAAGAVMRQLQRSVVTKRELGVKAKLAVFKSVFVPILTYGHEHWVMTERTRSRIQASEMSFLRKIAGLTRLDRVRNSDIRRNLGVGPLLSHIERSQLRYYGHVTRMSQDRLAGRIMEARPTGRGPRGRPRTRWIDYVHSLARSRLGLDPEQLSTLASDRWLWRRLLRPLSP